ncbi:MAG TPA: hypothetical protein VGJ69_14425 [Pyrinomonadaceae bacterium]|jgi:hypothetical protein
MMLAEYWMYAGVVFAVIGVAGQGERAKGETIRAAASTEALGPYINERDVRVIAARV